MQMIHCSFITELEFGTGVKERSVEVKILYDGLPELKESFFVSKYNSPFIHHLDYIQNMKS